ncbi:MAG: ABC transporter ATP-binding protein [Dermatophilaceae bacterium]|nr:ABC transporter ATP-binding protein [Intrasporangiaceae bacterium]
MSAHLSVERLTHRYPGADWDTVAAIDLTVPAGSMTAVLGPSGSGKSTLLRVVAGLLPAASGEVSVDGRAVTGVPPERRGIAMMFQKPHLFPHLSVLDNVAYADRIRGRSRTEARAAALQMLDLVHLSELASRHPRELSGGQEQRVALARALAADPAVLLLDEPFSALDTELRSAMHALLADIRASVAPTILLVTHDLAEASSADTVAVLVAGRLIQNAPVETLYRDPAERAVARLLGGFSELPTRPAPGGLLTPLGEVTVVGGRAEEVVVLVRQEILHVVDPQVDGAAAAGCIESIRWEGARQVARVRLATDPSRWGGPVSVLAEVAVGRTRRVGDSVAVRVVGPLVTVPAQGAARASVEPFEPALRPD